MLKRIIALMLIATPLMAGDYWVHPSGYFPHTDGVFSRSSDVVPATYWTDPYEANLFASYLLEEPQLEYAIECPIGTASGKQGLVVGKEWPWFGDKGLHIGNTPAGNTSYVTNSEAVASIPATFTNMTWALWVQQDNLVYYGSYVGLGLLLNHSSEFGLDYDHDDDELRATVNGTQYSSGLTPLTNEMQHMALSYDGLTVRVYTNGVMGYSNNVVASLETAGCHINCGAVYNLTYLSQMIIKDVRGYSRTLSDAEILTMAQATYTNITLNVVSTNDLFIWIPLTNDLMLVKSDSSNNPYGLRPYPSYANAPTSVIVGTNEFGDVQRAYSFDGADDILWWNYGTDNTLGSYTPFMAKFGTNDFAVSYWFYWNAQTQSDGIINSSGNDPFYSLLWDYKLSSGMYDGTQYVDLSGDDVISTNEWHHVLIVRDYGVEFCQYVDGIKQANTTNETQDIVFTGYFPKFGSGLNGNISTVRFYDFANTNAVQLFTYTHPTNNLLEKTKLP